MPDHVCKQFANTSKQHTLDIIIQVYRLTLFNEFRFDVVCFAHLILQPLSDGRFQANFHTAVGSLDQKPGSWYPESPGAMRQIRHPTWRLVLHQLLPFELKPAAAVQMTATGQPDRAGRPRYVDALFLPQ